MPSRAATITPLYDSLSTATFRRTNVAAEGLWRVSEALGAVTDTPAALELATRKAGELTEACAAAIVLTSRREQVLVSRWGAVTLPVGTRRADLRAALEHGFTRVATEPIRAGTRECAAIWR